MSSGSFLFSSCFFVFFLLYHICCVMGRFNQCFLNVEGLLRGDYASRMQGYATARQNGWMSANDIRELEDMNMIPAEEGGNLYLVNGSFTKLADAGAFAKKNEKEETTHEE
ncbi:phage portal protein [Ruminococcus callidus]|uniref:phage portal protein n=1 Tax=Ruminococcus callidus TaxID=40519 RepID=UPI0039A2909F